MGSSHWRLAGRRGRGPRQGRPLGRRLGIDDRLGLDGLGRHRHRLVGLRIARRNSALDQHRLGPAGRTEPDDVAIAQAGLPDDTVVVDVDPIWAARVVDSNAGVVDPDAGVDRAHARNREMEPARGVGSDQDVVDGLIQNEARPSLFATKNSERRVGIRGFCHARSPRLLNE
jgi:hypothetical protein